MNLIKGAQRTEVAGVKIFLHFLMPRNIWEAIAAVIGAFFAYIIIGSVLFITYLIIMTSQSIHFRYDDVIPVCFTVSKLAAWPLAVWITHHIKFD